MASVHFVSGSALLGCGNDVSVGKPDGGSHRILDSGARMQDARVIRRDASVVHDAGSAGVDSGSGPPSVDAGNIGLAHCSGAIPVMKARDFSTGIEDEPDWSCHVADDGGSGARSDAGADAGDAAPSRLGSLSFDPLLSQIVTSVTVDIFLEDSTLGAPAVTRVLATSEISTFPAPLALRSFSARVYTPPAMAPLYQITEVHEYGLPLRKQPVVAYPMQVALRSLAIGDALSGGEADPAKALLASEIRDCRGRPVSGGQFELIDDATDRPVPTGTSAADPVSSYASYALPTPGCTFTTNEQVLASWLMVNAPVNVTSGKKTHGYRLRLSGRRTSSDSEPFVLGEREVELFANGTTFVSFER